MAETNLPITECWYAVTEWISDGWIMAGKLAPDVFYRAKIAVSTVGLKITESQRLTLALETTVNLSFPWGCSAFLSDLDITDPSKTTQGSNINPSDMLANATLASAKARFADGTTGTTTVGPGTKIYYDLDSDQIKADKTYYIYLISTTKAESAVWSHKDKALVVLTYASTHPLYIEEGVGASVTVKLGEETLVDGDEVTHGDVLTVSFDAAEGYDLTSHTVNGETLASGGSHTVSGPVMVKATAALRTCRIGSKRYYACIGGKKYTAYIGGPDGKPVPYGRAKTVGGENT